MDKSYNFDNMEFAFCNMSMLREFLRETAAAIAINQEGLDKGCYGTMMIIRCRNFCLREQ